MKGRTQEINKEGKREGKRRRREREMKNATKKEGQGRKLTVEKKREY